MKKRKITARLLAFGKKNKFYKVLSICALFVYLFFYYTECYFKGNIRKYAGIACVVLVFTFSTSFAYPNEAPVQDESSMTVEGDYLSIDELSQEQINNIYSVNTEPTEILEDKDVMEGYENTELEYVHDSEKISMDEILSNDGNDKYIDVSVSGNGMSDSVDAKKLSRDDWNLILINKHHSIPDDYEFPLGNINASMQCDERIIPDLLEMLKAAKNDGVSLYICSPYRDINRQEVLFNRKIKAYMKQGMSYLDAYQISSQTVTVPGASEHQIGLAIDFLTSNYTSLNEGFGDTQAGKWLAEHACEYGFILRYPKGKEYITGIEFEPWHYRYVGKEAATQIMQQGLTLEEFVDTLE